MHLSSYIFHNISCYKVSYIFQDRSNAQVSCAGLFIGSHLGFTYPGMWLHIDMAAPAHNVSLLSHMYIM